MVVPVHNVENDDDIFIWNPNFCLNDPQVNIAYQGNTSGSGIPNMSFLGNYDVNKLRTVPYVGDNQLPPNNNIGAHTFWFRFGCCGEIFCADDLDDTYVQNDQGGVGSLLLSDVDVGWDTSIWINFMTQCENCTADTNGMLDEGSWYKWEQEYDADMLLGRISWELFTELVDIKFQDQVPCNGNATYGCQVGELQEG